MSRGRYINHMIRPRGVVIDIREVPLIEDIRRYSELFTMKQVDFVKLCVKQCVKAYNRRYINEKTKIS